MTDLVSLAIIAIGCVAAAFVTMKMVDAAIMLWRWRKP